MTRTGTLLRELAGVALLALIIFAPAFVRLEAQTPVQAQPDLVAMLKATPGCLGVETARTASGKQVIFAWFQNRRTLMGWINSDGHRRLMNMAPGLASGRAPLADIPDDDRPILAIVSLTPAETPQLRGLPLPVSQVAIEIYAPLPGGLAIGGRFAPDTVTVPGLLLPQGAR